jgi:hypothetical protein
VSDWQPSARELERRAVRRSRQLRSVLISTGMTVLVIGVLLAVVVASPGWPRFREYFFSWDDARDSLPDIVDGFWLNVRLFVVAEVFILLLGLFVALARTSRSSWLAPVRVVATVYTDDAGLRVLGGDVGEGDVDRVVLAGAHEASSAGVVRRACSVSSATTARKRTSSSQDTWCSRCARTSVRRSGAETSGLVRSRSSSRRVSSR